MKWELKPRRELPEEAEFVSDGGIRLSIGPAQSSKGGYDTDRQWQWCSISFGEHSHASHAECCATWPRKALELARKALDTLEAEIME